MSRFPSLYGGQRPTADLLLSALPDIYYKVGNTDRAATTTMADDPDLTTTLEANAVYQVEFRLHFAALDAARFQTQWTVPGGATGNRSAVGPDQGVILSASAGGQGRLGVHAYATACIYGTRNHATNQCWALEESIVTTSSAGTLAVQWAQVTSNATATRLAAGSSLLVRRLA